MVYDVTLENFRLCEVNFLAEWKIINLFHCDVTIEILTP